MRRVILVAAATAAIALAAGTAWADHGHRGPQQGWDYGHHGPHQSWNRGHHGPPGPARSYRYGPTQFYRGNAFGRAAWEVRQSHSRYRYHTHPRSYHNQPSFRFQYWGW